MEKTSLNWRNEAQTFLKEWGSVPNRDDVIAVCNNIAADPLMRGAMIQVCGSVGVYADTLWHWILKESGVNCM